jgi:hypothetical protein
LVDAGRLELGAGSWELWKPGAVPLLRKLQSSGSDNNDQSKEVLGGNKKNLHIDVLCYGYGNSLQLRYIQYNS